MLTELLASKKTNDSKEPKNSPNIMGNDRSAANSKQRRTNKPKRTKTFTGCWTCRSRKVKCDTKKPFCIRCMKSKLTCEGYDIKLRWSNPVNFDTSGAQITDDEINLNNSEGYFQRRNIDFVKYPKSMIYATYEDIDSDLTFLNNNSLALSTIDQSERKGPFTVFIGNKVTKEFSSRLNSNKKSGKYSKKNNSNYDKLQGLNNEIKKKLVSLSNGDNSNTDIADPNDLKNSSDKTNEIMSFNLSDNRPLSPAQSTNSTTLSVSSPSSSTIMFSSVTLSQRKTTGPEISTSAHGLSNSNPKKLASNTQIIIGNQHPLHKDNPKYVYPVLPAVGNLVNPITKSSNNTASNSNILLPLSLGVSSPSLNAAVSPSSTINSNTTNNSLVRAPNPMSLSNNSHNYYNSMISPIPNANNKFQGYPSSFSTNVNLSVNINTTPPIFSTSSSSISNNNNYHEKAGLAANDPSATSLFLKLSNSNGNLHTHSSQHQQPPPISMVMMQGFSNSSNYANTQNINSHNGNGENNSFLFTENFGFDYYSTGHSNSANLNKNSHGEATINSNTTGNNSTSVEAVVSSSKQDEITNNVAIDNTENFANNDEDALPSFNFGGYSNNHQSQSNNPNIYKNYNNNAENAAAAGMVMMNSKSNSNMTSSTNNNDSNDANGVGSLLGEFAESSNNDNNNDYSFAALTNYNSERPCNSGASYKNGSSEYQSTNNKPLPSYSIGSSPAVASEDKSNFGTNFNTFITSKKFHSEIPSSEALFKQIPSTYSIVPLSSLSLECKVILSPVSKFLIFHFVETVADLLTVVPSYVEAMPSSSNNSNTTDANPWKIQENDGYILCAIRAIGSHALFGVLGHLFAYMDVVDDCILNSILSFSSAHLRNQCIVLRQQKLKEKKSENGIAFNSGENLTENGQEQDHVKYWENIASQSRKNAFDCFKKIFFTSENKKSKINDNFFMALMGLVFLDTVNGTMISCRRVLTFMEYTLQLSLTKGQNLSPKMIQEFTFLNYLSKSTQITTNFKKFHNSPTELDSVANHKISSDLKLRSEQSLINLFKHQNNLLSFLKTKYGTKNQKQNFLNELKHVIDYYNSDIIYNLDKLIKNDDLFSSVGLAEINFLDSQINTENFDFESFHTLTTSSADPPKITIPHIIGHHHYLDSDSGAATREEFERKLKFIYKEYFTDENLFNENGIFGLPNSLKNIFANAVELFQVKINLINKVYVEIQPYKDKNRYVTPQDTRKLNDITKLISEFKDSVLLLESKLNSWELEWVLKDPFNEYNFKTKLHENVYHHAMSFKFGILIYFYRTIGCPPNSARPISDADINYYISKCLDHLFLISLEDNNGAKSKLNPLATRSDQVKPDKHSHSFLRYNGSSNYRFDRYHSVLPLMWQVFISASEIDPDDFLLLSKITRWFKKISVYCNDYVKLYAVVKKIWKFRKSQKVHFDDLDKSLTVGWLQFVREFEIDLMVI